MTDLPRRTIDADAQSIREQPAGDGAMQSPRRRHVSDLLRVTLGLVVLTLASLPVRPDAIGRMETGAFDLVNGLPDFLYPVVWGPMQLGSLMAVPLVAIPALLLRRRRLAIDAAVTGTLAWTLAKVVKDGFGRPRPGGLLDDVAFRGGEQVGMGFVSGHTAVAFALATAAVLHLPRRWRAATFGLAAVVGLSRIYVGAHLPLDVVGGAALGWAIGAAYRWAVGAPTGRPPTDRLAEILELRGFAVRGVDALPAADATSSAPYRLHTDAGTRFVKVVSDRPQDRDRLHRWWLRLTRQHRDGQRFASPLLQATHEAAMAGAAREAGVHVPAARLAESFDGGSAILVTDWVDATPLADIDGVATAAVEDAFAQLARLHEAGHAHGDVTAGNVLVDDERAWLVDFGDGRLMATPDQQARDVEDLLLTLAPRVPTDLLLRTAARQLGAERVARVLAERCPAGAADATLWEGLCAAHPEAFPVGRR